MKAAKVLTDVMTVANDKYIAITIDTWTSVSNVTFSSLTAHSVDSNWEHVLQIYLLWMLQFSC